MIVKNPPRITNRSSFLKYLDVDLWVWMKSITFAFSRLKFSDNFETFTVTNLLIPATKEIEISNAFQAQNQGAIPSGRIIIRQTGDANIIDGDTAWDANNVFLKNPSANDAIVTVIFFI